MLQALAQVMCDKPHGLRFREYAAKLAGLPPLPDDLWGAPLPPESVAMKDLRDGIERLSAGYGDDSIVDWILLREVAWRAATLARIKEAAIEHDINLAIGNNGGHTAALWHPPTYVRPDGSAVRLDSAAGRSALLEDLQSKFGTTTTQEGVTQ
jgi:hypothetical protein